MSSMVCITTGGFRVVLITDTESSSKFVTKARDPSGVNATSVGPAPTTMLVSTAGIGRALLMTATWPAVLLVTYTTAPSGRTATPDGWLGTETVVVMVLLDVWMTDTVPPPRLLT
jgi:hypothetical protein